MRGGYFPTTSVTSTRRRIGSTAPLGAIAPSSPRATRVYLGTGELSRVDLDESLMQPGEAEVVADLVVAAHADAKRKLDQTQAELMKEVAGPLAGMGLPAMNF